jgi:3-hydroxyacyl-CoA dehydrogenase
MKQAGFPAAGWVEGMVAAGKDSFYERGGDHVGTYNPSTGSYEVIKDSPAVTHFRNDKGTSKAIQSNSGASLVDLGDGVAGIELHAKMNVLDEEIFDLIAFALDRAEWDYEALVIGSDAENFSVGANLLMVLGAAQSGMWDQLGAAVKKMQDLNQRLRYFPRPVVGAPAGLALGGGAEILMHTGRVVAAAELYAGLVEAGSGVIPAGGGTKEMLRRILNPPMATQNADALPFLQRIFEQVGMAKVSTSADEALEMGILRPGDRVVLNRDHLLANAKQEARRMAEAGYRAPLPEKIYAAGRDALAALRVGVYMLKEGGTLSEYDAHLGNTLAYVMTGGELSAPTWVEEQYILDLEREAFLSLCGEEKSRQRMLHILQTGKPLRN